MDEIQICVRALVEQNYQEESNYWDKNLSHYYSVHIPNYAAIKPGASAETRSATNFLSLRKPLYFILRRKREALLMYTLNVPLKLFSSPSA